MNILAIQGSPRKNWNTHLLLSSALGTAAEHGATTELVHLADLTYTGCISCFACKRQGSSSVGSCVLSDDLAQVLARIDECDVLLIGSPLYFSEVTSMTRSFIERLLFRSLTYDRLGGTVRKKQTPTLLCYTSNMSLAGLKASGMFDKFRAYEQLFSQIFGPAKTLLTTETLQVQDYAAYHMACFDEQERIRSRRTAFPADCERAQRCTSLLMQGSVSEITSDIDTNV